MRWACAWRSSGANELTGEGTARGTGSGTLFVAPQTLQGRARCAAQARLGRVEDLRQGRRGEARSESAHHGAGQHGELDLGARDRGFQARRDLVAVARVPREFLERLRDAARVAVREVRSTVRMRISRGPRGPCQRRRTSTGSSRQSVPCSSASMTCSRSRSRGMPSSGHSRSSRNSQRGGSPGAAALRPGRSTSPTGRSGSSVARAKPSTSNVAPGAVPAPRGSSAGSGL